ncbi:uncharacterized protein LOC132278363 [Cornus florida]|uniref:uncharacterized protein LOC132278363 n=1 Tax=Cornus florida TaxID=4283 RepID=UPI00289D7986|nr:uncharacterized protein LOC132278363 [Cornus florida]
MGRKLIDYANDSNSYDSFREISNEMAIVTPSDDYNAMVRSEHGIALATATSGVASSLLPGGRTAHSRFKIPIIADKSTTCNISKQSSTAELLRKTKLIIWDEAPMAKRYAIEAVDRTLQDLLGNNLSFGGKVMVFGGDFKQVLPVLPQATRVETIEASDEEKLTLLDNMIQLSKEIVINYVIEENSENALIDAIFPSLQENSHSAKYITNRAILATRNDFVDKINGQLIERFPGESSTYYSFDKVNDDAGTYNQEEFLNSLLPNGLPPDRLTLKINCPILLLRNLDPANGLCNGTRLICRGTKENIIATEICHGQHVGKQVLILRILLSPAESEGLPFCFTRK